MRVLGENEIKPKTCMPQNVRLSEWLGLVAQIWLAEWMCGGVEEKDLLR